MHFQRLDEWLDWQSQLHLKSIDLGLDRVSSVWHALFSADAYPCPVITVAGTNGKGSSVALLEAVLIAAGYRVGCYTSPHLIRYNERIRIDGKPVDDERICNAFAHIDRARGSTSLTYFEFGTLAALEIFALAGLDAVILEVGLGGRLDAVNILDADLALITGIAIDHVDWLGDTREKIGAEKAGILRYGQVAVFSGDDIPSSVRLKAGELELDLLVAGEDFQVEPVDATSWALRSKSGQRLSLPMPAMRGRHQLNNAAGVIQLLLAARSLLPVSTDALRQGLLNAQVAGRFQVTLERERQVIIDVAHNPQSMAALAENLGHFVIRGQLHVIIGMLRDKAIAESLAPLLPLVDYWHIVPTAGERGLTGRDFSGILQELLPTAELKIYETLAQARESVLQSLQQNDTLLVTGSFLVAGEYLSDRQLRDKH